MPRAKAPAKTSPRARKAAGSAGPSNDTNIRNPDSVDEARKLGPLEQSIDLLECASREAHHAVNILVEAVAPICRCAPNAVPEITNDLDEGDMRSPIVMSLSAVRCVLFNTANRLLATAAVLDTSKDPVGTEVAQAITEADSFLSDELNNLDTSIAHLRDAIDSMHVRVGPVSGCPLVELEVVIKEAVGAVEKQANDVSSTQSRIICITAVIGALTTQLRNMRESLEF